MEEKKTKKIDLVVIMAILILIAFIGVMSFAMVQGIMQYTKKDAVAYADDSPSVINNLLYISNFGNLGINETNGGGSYGAYYFYQLPIRYDVNSSFYPAYAWSYNNYSYSKYINTSGVVAGATSTSGFYTNFADPNIWTGVGFPLIQTAVAGTYTFTFVPTWTSSNYSGVTLDFYTYINDELVSISSQQSLSSLSSSSYVNVTFTASRDFDNFYLRLQGTKNGANVYGSGSNYRFFLQRVYLASGSTNLDSSSFPYSNYSSAYTAGYYTALTPAEDPDIVGNNLFEYQFNQPWDDTYAKLVRNGDTYKGWQVHASGSAMYNYDEVNSLSVFKYYDSSVSYNYDFYYYLDDYDSGDYTFTFNYDYGDIDAHDFKLLALSFTIPETDPVSEETLAYIQDDNLDVTLTATYYQGRYLISIACMLSSSADLICRYAKLETGSHFTGFVPLDYYNYGYNQGYQNGQGDLLGSRNYILLDYLAFYGSTRNLTSDFVFNDTNYVYGDWTEDLNSVYNYNNPNFAIIDSLDGAPSGSQVGYKYENENLYGDILLMMPYCDDNLRVVFEVVDSGEVLITSPRDTVHWTLNSHLGNVNGQASWSCDLYTIHFYSPSQVNIYFLPYQPLDYGNEALYLPLNTKSWRVYSTQTNTALSSFDDGYLKGLDQGKEQQAEEDATLIARARGQGYEEGRRDALEDTSDYTFMGLIGSVIDAPITSFRGLLNFSILGVNMQSFVLAILTLCVIIVVIKIALGGK